MLTLTDFSLDAYGHLTYVVGWSDEWQEETPAMLALAKALDCSDEKFEQKAANDLEPDRGDWIACADFDRKGDYVAYHVVVNSDSGGFIDTLDSGVLTVERAREELPGLLETWHDVASEHLVASGEWFTNVEDKGNRLSIERWRRELAGVLA